METTSNGKRQFQYDKYHKILIFDLNIGLVYVLDIGDKRNWKKSVTILEKLD